MNSRTLTFTRTVGQTLCALILFKDYVAEAALVIFRHFFVLQARFFVFQCEGESMLPTLRSKGDAILVEKVSVAAKALSHGDVIIAVSPNNPDKLICKRIIAFVTLSIFSAG